MSLPLTWTLAVITVILWALSSLAYIIRFPSYRTYKMAQKLNGPKKWSILGVTFDLAVMDKTGVFPYIKELSDKYNGKAMAWLLGTPMVFLAKPEDIEIIMGSTKHIRKGLEYDYLRPWLNEGLLVSEGEKWRRRRKVLTPSFHFKILENNFASINKHARALVRSLTETREPVDVLALISLCTLDVICETAMGVTVNAQENKGKDYINSIKYVSEGVTFQVMNLYLKPWMFKLTPYGMYYDHHQKQLHDYTEKVIEERKAVYAEKKTERKTDDFGQKERHAFLDMLIELQAKKNGVHSDLDIREEVDTFMFEGHDTTSSALTFALLCLANHKDVQEAVYEEQFRIFGDSDRAAENGDLLEMTYLTKVIKETLRLYPSVPYMSRELTEDAVCGDITIPKGCNIMLLPYVIHRNESIFPDPEKFDPERFEPEEIAKRHPYAYIPFSAGPRNCIGQKFAMMELKIVLSTIIRKCQLEPETKVKEVVLTPEVILRSKNPIMVKFIPRN